MDTEALYRHAADAAGIGVFERDYATGRATWSAHVWRIYGLERQDEPPCEADLAVTVIHPEDVDGLIHGVEALKADRARARADIEFRIVHRDGDIRYATTAISCLRDGAGVVTGVRGVLIDITDRRRAEIEAEESAELFRRAANAANVCVFHFDHATGRRRWSNLVWTIFGLPERDELPSDDDLLALTHPDDLVEYATKIYGWRDDPAITQCEIGWRIVRPDGAVRHLHAATDYKRDATGRPISSTGVVSDVTERREAELAARESAAMFHRAAVVAGLCVFDHVHGKGPRRWSREVWALHGLPEQEGSPSDDMLRALIHPDDIDEYRGAIERFRAAVGQVHFQVTWRIARPDGEVRRLHAIADYVRNPDGTPKSSSGVVMDVTERWRAEEAVTASEARLRLAVEAAGMGVFDHDFRTGLSTWEPRIWDIYGYPRQAEAMGVSEFDSIVHPDDRARRRELVADLRQAAHGERRSAMFRIIRPDGSIRHIECLAMNECDKAGNSVRMSGVIYDVTERVGAEEALRSSEAMFRRAAEAARMGVFDVDLTTGIRVWSDRLWRIHGLEPRAAGPETNEIVAITHEEDRAVRSALLSSLFSNPENDSADATYRIVRPDGVVRHLVSRGALFRDQAGRPIRLRGITMDVTENRRAEEALAASEARFRLAADIAELGLFEIDVASRRRTWSARLWGIFGLAPRQEGLSEEEFRSLLYPDIRDDYFGKLQAAWADPTQARFELENRIIRSDGEVRELAVQGQFTRAPDGTVTRVQGVTLDVTEQRRSEAALRASETRFRLATDAAGFGVYEIDARTRRRTWSSRVWEMIGIAPRDEAYDDAEFSALLHPDDRETYARTVAALWADPGEFAMRVPVRIVRPDGEARLLDVQGLIVRDPEGRVVRSYGIIIDITERRRAEEALRTSEARFRLAADAAGMGIFEVDGRTGKRIWSARQWEICGLVPREAGLDDAEFTGLVHPADRETFFHDLRAKWADPTQDRFESRGRIVRPDGAVRYIEVRALFLRDHDGTVLRLHGVTQDVTDARLAEEALRGSEVRFRLAVDTVGMGVFERNYRTGRGILVGSHVGDLWHRARRPSPDVRHGGGHGPSRRQGQADRVRPEALAAWGSGSGVDDVPHHLAGRLHPPYHRAYAAGARCQWRGDPPAWCRARRHRAETGRGGSDR